MAKSMGFGGIIIMIGFFVVWMIIQLWYIILPTIVVIIGGYLLLKYYDNKEQEKQKRQRLQQKIIAQQRRQREKIRIDNENKRKEEERKQKLCQEEEEKKQRKIKEEQNRIKTRLELFSFTEAEAEILFGKTWRKRLSKPEKQFIEQEVSRIATKLEENAAQLLPKIYDFAEKVFDMIDYYVQIIGKQKGWDEIDYENWKEDWDDVRRIWAEAKYDNKRKSKKRPDTDSTNYYEILGISQEYTIKEIKVHYRKLMLKFHPDRNNSADAEERCKKINEAYEALSDPVKKKSYDQYGFIFE